MQRVLRILYSGLGWVVATVAFSSHMLIVLIITPFVRHKEAFNCRMTRPFIRAGFFILGWRITIEGLENIPKDRAFIVVSNHASHIDILSYLLAIPRHFAFVAKKELLNVPVLGWDIRSQGHIAIDRSNPIKAKAALNSLVESIQNNEKNLVIFAEGTRSLTGKVGKFKLGAFDLAAKSNALIIPASIKGTYEILSKGTPKMRPGKIKITFYPPVDAPSPSGGMAELERVRDQVKGVVVEGLKAAL